MEFSIKNVSPENQPSQCLVVGIYNTQKMSPAASKVDKATKGFITAILDQGDFNGTVGQTLLLHNVPGSKAERILLVGCGKKDKLDDRQFRKIIAEMINGLKNTGAKEAYCSLTELGVGRRDIQWKARQLVITVEGQCYRFDELKSGNNKKPLSLRKIVVYAHRQAETRPGKQGLKEGKAIANGMTLTKNLGNMPANICTPTYLATQARKLGKVHKIKISVLDELQMKKLGMGALLSVSKGSRQPAKLITLEYKGGSQSARPIVLVGKGVTFDSGGISIKPSASMDEMKYDMCGAASVFGTLKAVAEMKLPLNIVGIIPTTENLPDGQASKPGDIVTSMSGQTIEILNTDAEGRLILCDALTYAERFKPDVVIDIATLTGAVIIGLGHHPCGLLSNHEPLVKDLKSAGDVSGDRTWQLPLWEEYQDQLKSNFADMANIGGRAAGTITAACFLSRFTRKYNWAHLDIAGTAWKTGHNKGATGRPVPLLTQYLLSRVKKKK